MFFNVCAILIVFVVLMPSVLGFVGVIYPTGYTTLKGHDPSGDVGDLELYTGDDMVWQSNVYSGKNRIEVELEFDLKGSIGTDNWFVLRYKNPTDASDLTITVYYHGGSSDVFTADNSNGFTDFNQAIDDYKAVIKIKVYCYKSTYFELHLRYLAVHYATE